MEGKWQYKVNHDMPEVGVVILWESKQSVWRYRYLYRTVQYGTVPVPYATQVANLICSYRVRCACEPFVVSIPNSISRIVRDTTVVRITRPSSFSFWFGVGDRPCVRFACALVVFVLYSKSFRQQFVIFRLFSFKIHIRYSYENFYSFFSHFSEINWKWLISD